MIAGLLLGAAFVSGTAEAAPLIHSVRIEAAAAEVERLARYVDLAPGTPLDPDRLRHAAELIFATGAYEDVRIETEAATEGVDVIVRPVPGPLMVEIRTDESSPIGVDDIRRVAALRRGEPLWPARLESAAQVVALHLVGMGYVEALVDAEATPVAGGVAAVFKVRSGPRAHVRKVDVASDSWRADLVGRARPEAGEVWRKARARAAGDDMVRRLRKLGYWRAGVQVEDAYDPGAAAVDLLFRVELGPRMKADLRGGAVPSAARSAVLDLLRESGARSDVVDEAVDRLEQSLRGQGHANARARVREEGTSAEATLIFEVEPGPRVEVSRVRIAGDAPVPTVPLLTREGSALRDRDLAEDARTLTRLLRDQGYADARVDVDVPEGSANVAVFFRIKAGTKTEVASLDVASAVTLESAHELRTRPGGPYRAQDVLADRMALLTAFRNAGYLSAEVKADLRFSEDRQTVAVALLVEPGPQTRVDQIVITGLEHTREDTVRRELQLKEGDPLGLAAVLESQRRLGSLTVLGNVNITEIDPESVEHRSLLVSAEERLLTTVAGGIGYGERDYLRLSGEVTRRNLGGRDRSLTLFFSGSVRGLRLLTTYREPYMLGHRQDVFITAFREEEERETFSFTRYGLLFETARKVSASWSLIGRYSAQRTQSYDIKVPIEEIDRAFISSTVSGPALSIVHDTRDDPLDPHRGRFIGGDAQFSHKFLGGESFIKGFVQASAFSRIARHVVLAGNARLGLARTFAGEPPRLPLPDRFFAGGDYSLRGFPVDHAGPLEPSKSTTATIDVTPTPSVTTTTEVKLVPTGGNALLLGSVELRFDVGRYVGFALFGDLGNVFPLVSDMDLENLRYTSGVGLRYKSALGPIRVDWGYKLNRRPGESDSRLHFTVGHAF